MPVEVEKRIEVPVEKIVTMEKHVEVPVEKVITTEKFVDVPRDPPRCEQCNNVMDHDERKGCPVCPLLKRLKQPQAPTIVAQGCKSNNQTYEWLSNAATPCTVTVAHPQTDGWQCPCEVTMYVTTDGSDPSACNYGFMGAPPLNLEITDSVDVRAVAVSDVAGTSIVVAQKFVRHEPCGVGILLKKMNNYLGVYVQEVLWGGAVWIDGNINPGDEVSTAMRLACSLSRSECDCHIDRVSDCLR